MTTPNITSSTDSQMYNNIMAAGSRDRPPMLAPGRYPQWRSRFLRYVDTRPNGKALRKCILSGPYKPTTVLVHAVEAIDNSPAVPEHTTVKMPTKMSSENKAHFLAEKEAIHLLLTGIGDDIYSTVDACQTAQEMWEAIERLQQGESLNIQDVKTNLFWEFGKFTLHDGESMESYYTRFYKVMNKMIKNNLTVTTMQVNVQFLQQLQLEWSRFVTIVKQQHKLDEVSYYKLFDILKQYQNEVNELHAEKRARNANPLALVATAQASQDPYYQTPMSHRSSAPSPKPSIPSRSHMTTKHKGNEIAKPINLPFETASEEDSDPEQAQRAKDMQKNLALIVKYFKKIYKPTNINLKTSLNSKNKNVDTTPRYKNDDHFGQSGTQRTVNVDAARENVGIKVVQQSGIQCFNCREFGHFTKECKKPKRVKDSAYHKEKMLLCKQAEQADSGINSELVEQVQNKAGYNVFANHLQHYEQSESVSNTCLVETDDSNVTPDSPDTCEDDIQNEQNDVESDDERVALANLIVNLKLDVDENKKIQKQLKKANTTLSQELKECKTILAKTSKSLGESISVRDSFLVVLQTKEEHDIEKMLSMEKQLKFLNEVVYKRSQSIQTIHMMAPKVPTYNGRPTFANPRYLKQAQSKILCLYAFPYDQSTHANRLILDREETLALERESRSKLNKDSVHPYDYTKLNNALDELQSMYLHKVKECECLAQKLSKQTDSISKKVHFALLQHFAKVEKHSISLELALQKCKEHVKNDTVCNEKASNVFRKEREKYFKIQDLKAKLQDKNIAISELKKLIKQGKAKSVDTKFDRPSVVQQPNTQRISKPLILGKRTPFSNSLDRIYFQKTKSVPKTNVSEDLVQGNVTINRVYYVEGLNHNLFLVGQFCDADLEVAFRKSTCFVRDLQGNDLLIGNRGSNLYTISLQESTSSTPLCLMAKATPTQAWLWHRRLSHLNFDYINLHSKKDIVIGLPKLKYVNDQLCSSCELSKAKRSSFKLKAVPSSKRRLNFLHMDLCGPMRVASINGKKYILVIVDDYSRYTWTLFLRSMDETPKVLKDFLTMI
nr:retrovirus-related Pol polyprotein from transposon TNT 1-94 [Tanacetum cinerariifolium]